MLFPTQRVVSALGQLGEEVGVGLEKIVGGRRV